MLYSSEKRLSSSSSLLLLLPVSHLLIACAKRVLYSAIFENVSSRKYSQARNSPNRRSCSKNKARCPRSDAIILGVIISTEASIFAGGTTTFTDMYSEFTVEFKLDNITLVATFYLHMMEEYHEGEYIKTHEGSIQMNFGYEINKGNKRLMLGCSLLYYALNQPEMEVVKKEMVNLEKLVLMLHEGLCGNSYFK